MIPPSSPAPVNGAPLTPKEFADALGKKRSPKWVRKQCQLFVRTRGRRGIRCAGRPYLIPSAELSRFCSAAVP